MAKKLLRIAVQWIRLGPIKVALLLMLEWLYLKLMLLGCDGHIVHRRGHPLGRGASVHLILHPLKHLFGLGRRGDKMVLVQDRTVNQVLLVLSKDVSSWRLIISVSVTVKVWGCSGLPLLRLSALHLDDFILELDLDAFVALHLAHVRMIQWQYRGIQELILGQLPLPAVLEAAVEGLAEFLLGDAAIRILIHTWATLHVRQLHVVIGHEDDAFFPLAILILFLRILTL